MMRPAFTRLRVSTAAIGPGQGWRRNSPPNLLDAIRDEALLNLLLYTGLRVSECAALRVDNVLEVHHYDGNHTHISLTTCAYYTTIVQCL